MSATTRRVDTVQCDSCRKIEDNPKNWFTLKFHIAPRNDRLGQPGFLNDGLNRQGWDFCSKSCAAAFRGDIVEIVQISR